MFRLPVHLSRGAPLKSSLETHTEKWNSRHSKFSNRTKCPMVRPQWYSTLEKPTSGYQPQVGSDRVAFIKPNCPYVGQCSCPTNRDQSHHDLRSITATDCAILGMLYSSRALTDPTSSKTCTTRHTSNCTRNLRKTDHIRNVYSSTIATSKTTASTPDKLCPRTA